MHGKLHTVKVLVYPPRRPLTMKELVDLGRQ